MTRNQTALVLGGSEGIGFAYARRRAQEGDGLVLVGRRKQELEEAASALIDAGAARVTLRQGDLVDASFREQFLRSFAEPLDSLFIGGPSPPQGRLPDLKQEDFRLAFEIIIVYPLDFIKWAHLGGIRVGGNVIVLGSSTARESLCEHPFFLSALFRPSLEEALECYAELLVPREVSISVWRPRIVKTKLADHFVAENWPQVDDIDKQLSAYFGVDHVPTPDEFVAKMLGGREVDDSCDSDKRNRDPDGRPTSRNRSREE